MIARSTDRCAINGSINGAARSMDRANPSIARNNCPKRPMLAYPFTNESIQVNLDRCSADVTMINQRKNTVVVFVLCEQFRVVRFLPQQVEFSFRKVFPRVFPKCWCGLTSSKYS